MKMPPAFPQEAAVGIKDSVLKDHVATISHQLELLSGLAGQIVVIVD